MVSNKNIDGLKERLGNASSLCIMIDQEAAMKIVVLDGHALNPGDLSWSKLEQLGTTIVYARTASELIIERCRGAEIVLTNKTPLRQETLAQLPDLRYIGVLATGYDVVDTAAAELLGITVTNVPSYSTDSVAQFVFALLLELTHHVGAHSTSTRTGEWSANEDFSYWKSPLIELAGKTMGIIGIGRIGRKVAVLAQAFGMKVIAAGRQDSPFADDIDPAIVRTDLNALLREADVISLHCPLTSQTEKLINRDTLALMKPGAFLINTARGKLIAEDHLAEALNEGIIGGAALDVLSSEPPQHTNPLLTARNCIITPHIAWATLEARTRLLEIAIGNVSHFLSGDPIHVIRTSH